MGGASSSTRSHFTSQLPSEQGLVGPHFTDEKTEVQRDSITCPWWHSQPGVAVANEAEVTLDPESKFYCLLQWGERGGEWGFVS